MPPPRYFWLSFAAMVAFGVLNGVFGYLNWQERAMMRAEQKMTRTMLNSRAKVQVMLVMAASEGRPLTALEQREIFQLWQSAEYDQIETKK